MSNGRKIGKWGDDVRREDTVVVLRRDSHLNGANTLYARYTIIIEAGKAV